MVCVCLEECCRPSFPCIFSCMFRQALSPAGFVTEWVQWCNTIENSIAVVNRSSCSAGQNTVHMYIRTLCTDTGKTGLYHGDLTELLFYTSQAALAPFKLKALQRENGFQMFTVSAQENKVVNTIYIPKYHI